MVEGLVYNLSLLIAMVVIAGFMSPGLKRGNKEALLKGFLFGAVAIVVMLTHVKTPSGLIFDGRSVVVSLCTLFFGPIAGAVSVLMASICRIMIGGPGVMTGILVTVSCFAVGCFFWNRWTRHMREPTTLQLLVFGVSVHIVMLIMFFTLPFDTAIRVLSEITVPVMLTFPLATLLAGKIQADQIGKHRLFAELQVSEEAFRTMFDSVPSVGIQRSTPDGTILYWNKASEDLYGYTAEEAVGRNFADLIIPPELIDTYREEYASASRDLRPVKDYEVSLKRKDGSPVVVYTRNGVLSLPGRPVEFYAMDLDLTARRAAEDELRRSERLLANAQRVAQLGSWELNIPENHLVWSDEVFRIFGVERETFVETFEAFLEFVHVEDREMLLSAQARALKGDAPLDLEHRIVRSDGQVRFVHQRSECPVGNEGAPQFLSGTVQDITERRRAENDRTAAQRLAQATLDALTAEIAILDESGVIILANQEWKHYGQSHSAGPEISFEGANYLDVCDSVRGVGEEDAIAMAAGIRGVLSGELKDFHHDYACHTATVQMWFSATVTRFNSDELTFAVVAHENITARRLAEEKTRSDEERFLRQRNALIALTALDGSGLRDLDASIKALTEASGRTMEVSQASIWRFDPARSIIECIDLFDLTEGEHLSAATIRISEYPEYFEALKDQSFLAIEDTSTDPMVRDLTASRFPPHNPGALLDVPVRLEGRVEGVLCLEQVGSTRVWTADEKTFAVAIANLVSLAFEGSERGRAESEIHEIAERMQHYLAVSPTITYALRKSSAGLHAVWVSENVQHVLGYSVEEVLTPGWWWNQVHPEDRDRVGANQSVLMQNGSLSHEYRFTLKNERIVWIRDEIRIVGESLDGTIEFVGAWTDVTEQKSSEELRARLEEQLSQAQKMEAVGQLAGGMAHDFNNMLGVILGHTELALDEVPDGVPLREDLEEILKAGRRSADLTSQLLAFARRQTIAPEVLNLNVTIDNMMKMLGRLIGENIQLTLNPTADLWRVRMDSAQIDQIIVNLVLNARDAIAGSGRISIETENVEFDDFYSTNRIEVLPGRYVMLAISDDGSGMDKITLSRIFEPFFTTKEQGKGTGLGLAMVYGIVKQNNGFINVYSEPGMGTTFRIYLPRHDLEPIENIDVSPVRSDVRTGKETILLVEDEQALLALAKRLLESLGYNVIAVGEPKEAVRLARDFNGEIDLLMTDVVMPELSGRDVWEQISVMRPQMKCLFVSGYTADVIAQHNVMDSGVHFLQKPFRMQALAKKIREALDSKSGVRE